MPFNPATFDLPSRMHYVETWEQLRRAFVRDPAAAYRIEAGSHSNAVSLLSHLHRVRAAVRAQKGEEGRIYDHIIARLKRTDASVASGVLRTWVIEFRDRNRDQERLTIVDDAGRRVG